jgi:hypothetical protein
MERFDRIAANTASLKILQRSGDPRPGRVTPSKGGQAANPA